MPEINPEDFVDMKIMLARIDQKMEVLSDLKSDMGNVRRDVSQVSNKLIDNEGRIKTLEADVRELEAHNSWLRKTLIGAIISGVVALGFALIQVNL